MNNWAVELNNYNIKFKFIKGVKSSLANTLSRLINLELMELNFPEKESWEYGYGMFGQLPDRCGDSSEHGPAPYVDVSNRNTTIMKGKNDKDKEIQLSLSTKELINAQNTDTFCSTMLKLINGKKCHQINIS